MNVEDGSAAASLLTRAARGDLDAWGALLAQHAERLQRVASFRLNPQLRGRMDAADVVQETFIAATERRVEFFAEPERSLFLWLRWMVGNTLLELHRHHLDAQMRDPRREQSFRGGGAAGGDATDATRDQLAAQLTCGVTGPATAMALYGQEDYEGAVRFSTAAASLRPYAASAYHNLGLCLTRQKKLDDAATAYRKVVELRPDDPGAYTNLANTLRNQRKLDAAIEVCRAAIARQPNEYGHHFTLGTVLRDQGKPQEFDAAVGKAIAVALNVIERNPKDAGAHYYWMGLYLRDLGKSDEAVDAYRKSFAAGSAATTVTPSCSSPSPPRTSRPCDRRLDRPRQAHRRPRRRRDGREVGHPAHGRDRPERVRRRAHVVVADHARGHPRPDEVPTLSAGLGPASADVRARRELSNSLDDYFAFCPAAAAG